MKWKTPLLKTVRWVTVVLTLVLLISFLGGVPSPDIPFENLEKATLPLLPAEATQPADNRMIRRLYGLNPADYEGFTLYYPITNMGVDELLLVKLRDPAQAETVKKAIESRLAAQKQSFDGYGEEQTYALTHNMYQDMQGVYVLFTVSADGDTARNIHQAFLDTL